MGWGVYRAIQQSMIQLQAQQALLQQQVKQLKDQAATEFDAGRAEQILQQAEVLSQQASDYWQADWSWLLLAGSIYAVSLIPSCAYWMMCMNAMSQHVPIRLALWAYFYGNLGKYVPGKAMVVVLRVTTLAPWGIRKVATTLAIFIETLTSMAVGGAVAAVCLLWLDLPWQLRLLAAGLLVATTVPTAPALLRLVLRKLQPGVDATTLLQWTKRLDWRLTLKGWGCLTLTWLGYGLSLGCVLSGLPSSQGLAESAGQYWLSVYAACALAIVIGFVSLMPGGAGVREVVLATVLSPVVGPIAALSCAIWLRIAWVAAELFLAGLCFVFARGLREKSSVSLTI